MITLANNRLVVRFRKDRPFPLTYLHLPTGTNFGGMPEDAAILLDGAPTDWADWRVQADTTALPLHLGYDLRHKSGTALRFGLELCEYRVEATCAVLQDAGGKLASIAFDGPFLEVDASTGKIWRFEWTQKGWDEKLGRGLWSPDLRNDQSEAIAPDLEPRPTTHCCWSNGQVCAAIHTNQRYLPLWNCLHGNDGSLRYEIGLSPYVFRARKRTLDPLRFQIAFLPDINADGNVDECDYQLWVNRQMPDPNPKYREAIWYKIYCGDPAHGVTTSLAQALEIVERVHRCTDGLPQIAHLVGWQYNGHDTGYPSLDKFNEALGTRQELWNLHHRCKNELNTTLTYHINLDDSYPKHPGWDPDVIGRESSGELMRWEEYNGEMSYHINHTKDVESGKVFGKLEAMMREVPLEGAIHIDAFRNMNWSWEPDGFIGPIEELECGVKPIVKWLNDRGIDVTTESADHSAADWTGIVDGILHVGRPRDLVQLRHGKLIYGGRFWPPSVWGYGLGTSINWDVIYGDCAVEWYGQEWWPLLLDGIYLGTLLYHHYLQSEMLSAYLDETAATLRFSDGTVTEVRRDGTLLRVTQNDLILADQDNRFIPRGNAIYAYSQSGSSQTWPLPERFRNKRLDVKTLGDQTDVWTVEAGGTLALELRSRVPVKIVFADTR